jgi:hypothetical protein
VLLGVHRGGAPVVPIEQLRERTRPDTGAGGGRPLRTKPGHSSILLPFIGTSKTGRGGRWREGAYSEGGEGGGRRAGASLAGGLEQREVLALLRPAGLPRGDRGPLPLAASQRGPLRRRLPPQKVPERHAPGPPPPAPRCRRHPY